MRGQVRVTHRSPRRGRLRAPVRRVVRPHRPLCRPPGLCRAEDVAQGVFQLAWRAARDGVPVTLGWLVGAADSLLPTTLGLERRVLRLRFWDRLSISEIATVTGESRTAVARHLNAARRVPVSRTRSPRSTHRWADGRGPSCASWSRGPPRAWRSRRRGATPEHAGPGGARRRRGGDRRHDRGRAAVAPPDVDRVLDFPFYTSTAALEDASDTIVRGTLTAARTGPARST